MKNIILPLAIFVNTNVAFAQNDSCLILSNIDCRGNTCSSHIVNSNNEKQGEFFLAKKVNPETGVSIYTAETINSIDNTTDSNLIVCIKSHECRLFKSSEGFKADYAFINNKFLHENSLANEDLIKKRNTDAQLNTKFFNVRADSLGIFDGNEALGIPFPNKYFIQ